MCIGLSGTSLDLLIGSFLTSIADVLPDCGVEQHGLLADQTDLLAEPADGKVTDIVAVD